MLGFQAAGAAPIVEGHPIEHPETVATAIRIGNPASWYGATSAASESGGGIAAVTDDEILAAYRFLAAEESVFCEPASAASVAGLLKTGLPDGLGPGSTVVCVLTGHGLKDPDIAISQISVPTVVDADLGAVLEELSLCTGETSRGPGGDGGPPVRPRVVAREVRLPVVWVHRRLHNVPVRACGRDLLVASHGVTSPHAASGGAAGESDLETGDFLPLIPWRMASIHLPTRTFEARKPMTAEQQLERSVLEGKEREELHAIAQALSVKTNTRTKKADMIDGILKAAGVSADDGNYRRGSAARTTVRTPAVR